MILASSRLQAEWAGFCAIPSCFSGVDDVCEADYVAAEGPRAEAWKLNAPRTP